MEKIRRHYPEPPLASAELLVKGLGIREAMRPGVVKRPRGAETFLLVCFLSDAVDIKAGKALALPAGSFFVWRPREPHEFGNPGKSWNHSWLLASGNVVESSLKDCQIPCGKPLQIAATPFFENALAALHAEFSGRARPNPAYARNIVQNMLIDIGRAVERAQGGGPKLPEEYLEAKAVIEERFAERLTLGRLAKLAGRSPQRFSARYKELFGISPIEHVVKLRLAAASALLENRSLQIKDVAAETGFESPQYFSRMFRRRYGISPSRTRRREELALD